MNALLKLKAAAERNPKFYWKAVAITAEQFDPLTFIRWMEGLGWRVTHDGSGTGFSTPEHVRPMTKLWRRSEHAAFAALNGAPDSDTKHKKLQKYLDQIIPEPKKAHELDLKARRLVAEHAEYLPIVKIGMYCFDRASLEDHSKGIPTFAWSEEDICSDARASGAIGNPAKAAEWRDKRLAEFAKQRAAYDVMFKSTDPEIKAKIAASYNAHCRAQKLWEKADGLRSAGRTALQIMFHNIKPHKIGTGKPCAVDRKAPRRERKALKPKAPAVQKAA